MDRCVLIPSRIDRSIVLRLLLRRIRLVLFAAILLATHPAIVGAQWSSLASFGSGVITIHFQDDLGQPRWGYIGLEDGRVLRTVDGGKTWLPTIQDAQGPITAFAFKDLLNGWFSVRQGRNLSGIYRTSDGGMTWTAMLNQIGDRVCVYYNRTFSRLFLTGIYNVAYYSIDDGARWLRYGPTFLNGVTFSTGLIGVTTSFQGPTLFTNDGGASWGQSNFSVLCVRRRRTDLHAID
jgi:photosystem II stability/assembly factor-like uncharacterized protein